MIRESKRAIAGAASLLILIFHCWIPVFAYTSVPGVIERFLITTAYVGVDIFFFISAYSLARKPVDRGFKAYMDFIGSRALRIIPYFLIALLAGQFIWFLPAIMMMYILFPPIYGFCDKRPVIGLLLTIIAWLAAVYVLLGKATLTWDPGIALFRVPVIILGAFFGRASLRSVTGIRKVSPKASNEHGVQLDHYYEDVFGESRTDDEIYAMGVLDDDKSDNYYGIVNVMNHKASKLITALVLIALGIIIINKFGYMNKLNEPYKGTFYILAIPMALGIIMLVDYLHGQRRLKLLEFLGGFTLELYFMQMILGGWMIEQSYAMLNNRILTNLVVIVVLIAASWLISVITKLAAKMIRQSAPQFYIKDGQTYNGN